METYTLSQLVEAYNKAAEILGKPTVKKFSTKPIAIKRTTAIVEELEASVGNTVAEVAEEQVAEEAPVADEPKAKKGGVNFLGMRTDIAPGDEIDPLRKEGTVMQILLPIFRKAEGATFEELAAVFAEVDARRNRTSKRNVRVRIYEAVRQFTYTHGYGTVSTPTTIRLVKKGEVE